MSINPNSRIEVPEDRFGLYAIDVLDPDLVIFVIIHFFICELNVLVLFVFLALFYFLGLVMVKCY